MNHRLIAIGMLLGSCGAHAATADDYAYAWPLQTQGDSAAWQVELTPEVYAAIRTDDLRDVEVVNAAGQAVPTAAWSARTTIPALWSIAELPLFVLPATKMAGTTADDLHLHIERDAQGRLRRLDSDVASNAAQAMVGDLILDANALKEPIESLWLTWDETETVNAQFSISGSDDLQQWRTLAPNATVLAIQQDGHALSRRQIVLNGAHASYLRLHRLDTQAMLKGLHVRARAYAHSRLVQPTHVWIDALPTAAPAVTPPSPMAAAFYYRLPAPLPAVALKVELAEENSLAHVLVASRGPTAPPTAPWAIHADFTAFRLRQGDTVVGNDEDVALHVGRVQDWRIEVATPLDHAPSLRIAFRPDRFVFLAQGAGPYRLVAGSARAHRGDYPIDAAIAQLRGKLGADWQPELAALGPRVDLIGAAAYTPLPPQVHRDWKTWILWAVLIGAAALIGGLALSLLKAREPASKQES